MNKNEKMVTPAGKAYWAHLDTPEVYDGAVVGYTINLELTQEETANLIEELDNRLEAAKSEPRFKGKKWLTDPFKGLREDKEGNLQFRFKKKTHYIDKNGDPHDLSVPIVDAHGNPIPKGTPIGNGSIVRVAFTPIPFNTSRTVNGLSLRLEAVQVLSLKSPDMGAAGDTFGFDVVDGGYTAPQDTQSNDGPHDEPSGFEEF